MITIPDAVGELAGSIERTILSRTHGRVRNLRIEVKDHTIVLDGVAPTHYIKQLALDGALVADATRRIVNKIRVS
jgi:hypothetical protein